jgi:N-acetylglucosaminyl-diphospho-decaprenol L-rhamnosyltransferase
MAVSADVVIPTRNRYDLLESCLRHLSDQTLAHRVIVVDNHSSDGTSERLRCAWPDVVVRIPERPSGFSVSCNFGARTGDAPVIVLLNNDVDCRPDFLARLAAPLAADPELGAVAALLLQPDERLIDSVGLCADVTLAGFPRLHGLPASRSTDTWPKLAGPVGAAAAYRRTAWEQVGGLDERITAYMEDLDLALRLRSAGWTAAAAVGAVGVHVGSATHAHRSSSQRRLAGFARGYLLRRYGVLRGGAAARALATEAAVVLADMLISRDTAALSGRLAGWRAGDGLGRISTPRVAIDSTVSFRDSMMLRREVYGSDHRDQVRRTPRSQG